MSTVTCAGPAHIRRPDAMPAGPGTVASCQQTGSIRDHLDRLGHPEHGREHTISKLIGHAMSATGELTYGEAVMAAYKLGCCEQLADLHRLMRDQNSDDIARPEAAVLWPERARWDLVTSMSRMPGFAGLTIGEVIAAVPRILDVVAVPVLDYERARMRAWAGVHRSRLLAATGDATPYAEGQRVILDTLLLELPAMAGSITTFAESE